MRFPAVYKHQNSKILLVVLILIAGLTGCVTTTSVKKTRSLGLEIPPNSTFMVAWEHEYQYVLANELVDVFERKFAERSLGLVNFHNPEIQKRLGLNPLIKRKLTTEQISDRMKVDFICKFYIVNLSKGYNTSISYYPTIEDYYRSFETFANQRPRNGSRTSIGLDVISVKDDKILVTYEGETGTTGLGLPLRDGVDVSFNSAAIRSKLFKGMKATMRKVLKDHYQFN